MTLRRFPSLIYFPKMLALAAALVTFRVSAPAPGRAEGTVYFVSPEGNDANSGSREHPWRYIEWAMTRPFLRGADTIRIRGGVYRPVEEPDPRRDSLTDDTLIRPVASGESGHPITVMAEPGETVVLSGRFLATSWKLAEQPAGVYFHSYSTPVAFPYDHPFQVAEEGRLLYRVSTLKALDRPGRCFVDIQTRRIYVRTTDGRPPSAHRMEYGVSALGIEFRGAVEHWRLSGFALAGFRTAGIMVRDQAGHIEIDHMDISYIGAHRPGADPTSGYAIAIYDTSGGNLVHDNNLHHTLAETVHISQTGASGDLYENNEIHEAGDAAWVCDPPAPAHFGPGMVLRAGRITVRGNRFFRNGHHGLILESDLLGSEGPSHPSQNIVEGNVFSSNGGNGIFADGKNGLTASRSNIIRFNLFEGNNQARAGSNRDGGLRLAGNFSDTLVYNNTFYGEKANSLLVFANGEEGSFQGFPAAPERVRIVNNIAVQLTRASGVYPLRVVGAGLGFMADYNNWYRPGGPGAALALISWNGTEYASLVAFQKETGNEKRGLSLDPRFGDPENGRFRPRPGSPMIGRGLADIRGDGSLWAILPPGTAPNLGAHP